MKKYLTATLAMFVLLATSSAFAQVADPPLQDSSRHELTVTIPAAVMIRIVPTDSSPTAAVAFDFVANEASYLTAIEAAGGTWVGPTSHNLGAIEVLAVGSGWRVTVDTSADLANTGIGLDRVRVTRAASAGQFLLNSTANIATGLAGTWQSLGISGDSYELLLDGTENAASDTIEVIYTVYQN